MSLRNQILDLVKNTKYTKQEIANMLNTNSEYVRQVMKIRSNSTITKIAELAPNHTRKEIASKLGLTKSYVDNIASLAKIKTKNPRVSKIKPIKVAKVKVVKAKQPKPIIVKPRNVAKTSKTVSSKIKVGQSDMNKGNAKLTAADKVMPTLVRDESKVRAVRLDSKTTKLLYPGQSGYDTPIEVLRSEWEKKQEEGFRELKGA